MSSILGTESERDLLFVDASGERLGAAGKSDAEDFVVEWALPERWDAGRD